VVISILLLSKPSFFLDLLPSLLAEALAGGSTPVNAGWGLLFVDILLAFLAFHPHFIRENLDLSAAVRALVQRDSQISHILSGAMYH
jgi:hypothetical protein